MRARLAILAVGALLLLALPLPTVQSDGEVPCGQDPLCPDLVTEPRTMQQHDIVTRTFSASSCSVQEGATQEGTRTLLRFTFTSPNVGPGDLVIGAPADHPEWFTWAPCHRHYHFDEYADYRLWTLEGYPLWLALRAANPLDKPGDILAANPQVAEQMVAGGKAGFCVIDLRPVTGLGAVLPAKYRSCGSNQGISTGWADEYSLFLDGQWVDITGLPGGLYMLEAEVNPERFYVETVYHNNAAAIPVEIP